VGEKEKRDRDRGRERDKTVDLKWAVCVCVYVYVCVCAFPLVSLVECLSLVVVRVMSGSVVMKVCLLCVWGHAI
jgi:hypothetical protein